MLDVSNITWAGVLYSREKFQVISECLVSGQRQWRRQDFVTGGKVWVYRGSRVRSPPVPVVLSVYQRGSLLDGLAM